MQSSIGKGHKWPMFLGEKLSIPILIVKLRGAIRFPISHLLVLRIINQNSKGGPKMCDISSRVRKTMLLVSLYATLVVFPFASPVNAMEHGHGSGGVVHVYPASWGWGWEPGWGWGGPFWDGYWPDYWYDTGTIKLENVSKTDEIHINGSYAGEASNLRSIHLDPGTYRVMVKHNGKEILNREVYVMRGETTRLEVGDKHGTIRLKGAAKEDLVYINGCSEGEVKYVKDICLDPGTYKVTVTNHGRDVFDQQITLPTNTTVTLKVGDRG